MSKLEKIIPVDSVAQRRRFLQTAVVGGVGAAILPALAGARENRPSTPATPEVAPFELDELTIADLQAGLSSGQFTCRSLVEKYKQRIEEIDRRGPAVNSVIELNPDALAIAQSLDKERKAKGARGGLHGIPVLIKDNIDTTCKPPRGRWPWWDRVRYGTHSWRRSCVTRARSFWGRPI